MSARDQYEFFKYLFEAEEKRHRDLIDRGKTYLTVLTIYAGFISLTIKDADPTGKFIWVFIAAMVLFILAFASTITALGIFSRQGVVDEVYLLKRLPMDDNEFFDERCGDFTVATRANSQTNNHRANLLMAASIMLLMAIVVHGAYFVLLWL